MVLSPRSNTTPPTPSPLQLVNAFSALSHHTVHAYVTLVMSTHQHPIDRAFLIPTCNRTIHALLALHSCPTFTSHSIPVKIRISNLHNSATALTDHSTGLLLLNHLYSTLGPLFPHGFILHCRQSSATRAFLKVHPLSKLHTNPA